MHCFSPIRGIRRFGVYLTTALPAAAVAVAQMETGGLEQLEFLVLESLISFAAAVSGTVAA